jgi:hypothetical protein
MHYAFPVYPYKRSFFFFLSFLALTSAAQSRRENEPYCDARSAKKATITSADARVLGFAIGGSTLGDVQKKLGPTRAIAVSREEESDVSICYFSPLDGTVLIFYTGVMGGGEDITWFAIWSREAAFPHRSECSPSKLVSRTLSTASGLRLDLTRTEWARIAGIPNQTKSAFDQFDFLCRRKMTEEEIRGFKTANGWDVSNDPYFDRMSWIKAWYKNSRASRIEIGEVESY